MSRPGPDDICWQCMSPKRYCHCTPGRHRLTVRRPMSHVLHADLIAVPVHPPVYRGLAVAVAVVIGLAWVAGGTETAPPDVGLVSCSTPR